MYLAKQLVGLVEIFILIILLTNYCYAIDNKNIDFDNPDLVRLYKELEIISRQIEISQSESQEFGRGALRYTIELSIATRKNSKAKIANNINIIEACTSKMVPQNTSNNAKKLIEEINNINSEIDIKQREADSYGNGLIRATIISTIAMMENTRAMLEEQLVSEKYIKGCSEDTSTPGNTKDSSE